MCDWSLLLAYVRAQHSDQQMASHPTLIQKPKLFRCVVLYMKAPTFPRGWQREGLGGT